MLRPCVLGVLASIALTLAGCGDGGRPTDDLDADTADQGHDADPPGFDGHTVSSFASAEAFHAFAGEVTAPPEQVKFIFTRFTEGGGDFHYLDPAYYALHDEWYMVRLAKGVPIDGWKVDPLAEPLAFDSIAELYEAVRALAQLPLGLRWTEGRLYAPVFYDFVLGRQFVPGTPQGHWEDVPRFFGAGSLLHFPANPERPRPEALWLFELEYPDTPTEADLVVYFEHVEASLPPELRPGLKWLARSSAHQLGLAEALRAGDGPLRDRVVLPEELVVPGEVIAYNEGITAGQVKMTPLSTIGGASVSPSDLLVLAGVPDYLPPVAGIITEVPQTPLAHLNLLAKSRGTPNAYVGGASRIDPRLADWDWSNAYVILEVRANAVRWKKITTEVYNLWLAKRGRGAFSIPQVDLETAPRLVDLTEGGLAESRELIPLIGGKCAGMMAFREVPELELPRSPLCLTVKPYAEHLADLRAVIEDDLLGSADFANDRRLRFVVLEGADEFRLQHAGSPTDLAWLDEKFLPKFPAAGWLGYLARQGGLKGEIERRAMDPAFEAEVRDALLARFPDFVPEQGIRFRSSSTAEDVEGFNGAGLYDSNTGYLHPEQLSSAKLRERTLAWAIKRTWASYWTFEAFEERRAAGIDHLSGHMAVVVHPTYTDVHELMNGVITFSLSHLPDGTSIREMVVNAQHGALSVTNPPPGVDALPEVTRVTPEAIERVQAAHPDAAEVMSDDELRFLHTHVGTLADLWLTQANAALPKARRSRSLVLDLELKRMAGGWPMTTTPQTGPPRLVLKQVRVLDRAPPVLSATEQWVDLDAIPKDVMAAASTIELRRCRAESAGLELVLQEIVTDRAAEPLVPWSVLPFTSWAQLSLKSDLPGLKVRLGPGQRLYHTLLLDVAAPDAPETGWSLAFRIPPPLAVQAGWATATFRADGTFTLSDGAATYVGSGLVCDLPKRVLGPSAFLEAELAKP